MLTGFSTGCLHASHDNLSPKTFDVFRKLGCNSIELMWHEVERSQQVLELSAYDLRNFKHISIHAPSFETYTDAEVFNILNVIAEAHRKIGFSTVVIHPHAAINWEILKRFDLPFAIENMDWRKEIGKYVESMRDIFSKCDYPMVLDLNHCYTNDPSMHLAYEMIDAFRDRIVEIHLSGFEKYHEPLFKTGQHEILEAIFDKDLPIIIESDCQDVKEVAKEFEFVRAFLNSKVI